MEATVVWQTHNTCLDLLFQPRYRGISMCFVTPRIEFALSRPIIAGMAGRSLSLPQNAQPRSEETLLGEYDSANLHEGLRQSQSTAGCFLELLK